MGFKSLKKLNFVWCQCISRFAHWYIICPYDACPEYSEETRRVDLLGRLCSPWSLAITWSEGLSGKQSFAWSLTLFGATAHPQWYVIYPADPVELSSLHSPISRLGNSIISETPSGGLGERMCFPPRGNRIRCELAKHRNPQSCLPVRNTQKGACSLAGQADCGAVTLEGTYPLPATPDISEFCRNSEM